MAVVLVVEDDLHTRQLTKIKLAAHYTVVCAADGEEALLVLEHQRVDVIVADIMMPRLDGYGLVRELREARLDVPVIMVTARDAFADKRQGFALGADDYMVKPIDYEELVWRIDAILRRAKIAGEQRITVGGVTLDSRSYTVSREGQRMDLPKKEFELLFKLLSYPGVIFTKNQLLEDIWGYDSASDESTVKTHISRLRSRFEGTQEFRIVTLKGLGYKAEIGEGL